MTMTSEPTVPTCRTCGKQHGNGFNPVHPYNDGSLPTATTFGQRMPGQPAGTARVPAAASEAVVEAAWPFDPVLRQALITKGVLTPEDLRDAETQIRAVTAQMIKEGVIG